MGWLHRRSDPGDVRSRGRRSPDRRARRFSPHAEAMEGGACCSRPRPRRLRPRAAAPASGKGGA